jgi:hypothetical protein
VIGLVFFILRIQFWIIFTNRKSYLPIFTLFCREINHFVKIYKACWLHSFLLLHLYEPTHNTRHHCFEQYLRTFSIFNTKILKLKTLFIKKFFYILSRQCFDTYCSWGPKWHSRSGLKCSPLQIIAISPLSAWVRILGLANVGMWARLSVVSPGSMVLSGVSQVLPHHLYWMPCIAYLVLKNGTKPYNNNNNINLLLLRNFSLLWSCKKDLSWSWGWHAWCTNDIFLVSRIMMISNLC